MKTFIKILLLATFIINHSALTIAQNLVPNPSFEDTTGVGCPNGITQSILPNGWSSYWNTPDYFNSCSPTSGYNSIPNNYWGYQFASSGNAYCGIWAYQTIQSNAREYIGGQLLIPTIVGQKYYARIKVNLAEISNCGINNIGILLSTIPYINGYTNPAPIRNFAHVYTTAIITDTSNWTSISGTFIADSAYQYIIIGNFFDDINTDTLITDTLHGYGYGAYYFIDDVYLGTDSLSGTEIHNLQDKINIYPNPAKDELFVKINNLKKFNYTIYTISGFQIKKGTVFPINLTDIPSGLYFLQIQSGNDSIIKKFYIIR